MRRSQAAVSQGRWAVVSIELLCGTFDRLVLKGSVAVIGCLWNYRRLRQVTPSSREQNFGERARARVPRTRAGCQWPWASTRESLENTVANTILGRLDIHTIGTARLTQFV